MDLRYKTSRATLARWYWQSLRRNPRHRWRWLSILACSFLVTVAAVNEGPGVDLRAIGVGALITVVLAAFLALYPQLRFKSQERVLRLTSSGISSEIAGRAESFRWADVASITDGGDDLALTFRNLNAFIVPMSAFASMAERNQCVAECRQWLAENRKVPAA